MTINLTNQESMFLTNLLVSRREEALFGALPQQELDTISKLLLGGTDYSQIEVGYLQYVLQEQNEVWGSRRSTANEKSGTVGPGQNFVPHKMLVLIKSISDKLGASLSVDIDTKTDQTSPRGEGSTWIMTTLYPNEK